MSCRPKAKAYSVKVSCNRTNNVQKQCSLTQNKQYKQSGLTPMNGVLPLYQLGAEVGAQVGGVGFGRVEKEQREETKEFVLTLMKGLFC